MPRPLTVLALGAAMALLPCPAGATAPPPGSARIELVMVNGSGCPVGTAAVAMAPDNSAFVVTYSNYLVVTSTAPQKYCQLQVHLTPPEGRTYAVTKAAHAGYAFLARGASLEWRSLYAFMGTTRPPYRSYVLEGPWDDNWQVVYPVPAGAETYMPCPGTRDLLLVNRLVVRAGTSTSGTESYATLDSTDVFFASEMYELSWATCPTPSPSVGTDPVPTPSPSVGTDPVPTPTSS